MKRYIKIIAAVALTLSLLCSCSIDKNADFSVPANARPFDYEQAAELISAETGLEMTAVFLESMGKEKTSAVVDAINNGSYTELSWLEITDYSYHVIADLLAGRVNKDNINDKGFNGKETFSVSFAGDILFEGNSVIAAHAEKKGGVLNCIDSEIIDYLNASDIFMINNEFTLSERGAPLNGKTWTFRENPENLGIFRQMGVDIVSLANNHIYDYGPESFEDTIANLDAAGIPHVGAGMNLGEAAKGYYYIVNGIKVGFVAASCAENVIYTPVADESNAGIMGTYDSAEFIKAIKAADSQCDILVAYVHWGTEYSTELDAEQKSLAREYIDAGVDAVIGGHTHCLQGMEYYNGKPIIYSVGNFWFNSKTLDSCVITLNIDKKLNVETVILPLEQKGCETRLLYDEEARALFDRIESYEPQGVKISDAGVITPSDALPVQ